MKILAISISAYNQEMNLDRCVSSLIIPSIDDLEIFIVNDGSTDKTSAIAHKWAEKYPQSITVVDKKNGHMGSCLNKTMSMATAKYYKNLDADDYYDSEALEQLVNRLKTTDADMIITTHVICRMNGNESVEPGKELLDKEMLISDVDFTKHNLYSCFGMHGVAYKTSSLGGGKVCLTEGAAHVDAEYAILPFKYCKTILFLNLPVYMYVAESDGIHLSAVVTEKSKNQAFMVASHILNDYLSNMSDNLNTRNAQRIVVSRSLVAYYGLYISYFRNNTIDDQRIKRIEDLLLKNDKDLYEQLNNVHRLKWHFIKRYRATGHTQMRIMSLLGKIKSLMS